MQGTGQFIRDRAQQLREALDAVGGFGIAAEEDHRIAGGGFGFQGQGHGEVVHAHAAHDGVGVAAVAGHGAVAQVAAVAVGVAAGEGGDLHRLGRHEGAAITHGRARGHGLYAGDFRH